MTDAWNASAYARNGRFVADLAGDVVGLLAAQPGEQILDLGCGDGVLTERLRKTGAHVLGMDRSREMVRAAQERGLEIQEGSGEELPFNETFDAVFSNAALHWMLDQDAVLSGVHRALRPKGRFVAELGGHGNIAAIRTALRAAVAPFDLDAEAAGSNVFFTADEYTALLERHGFVVEAMDLVPRPTLLATGMRAWLETFRAALLKRLTPAQQETVLTTTVDLLRPVLCDRKGNWYADYVRLRFRARKVFHPTDAAEEMVALP